MLGLIVGVLPFIVGVKAVEECVGKEPLTRASVLGSLK
jgi:hypothetical protein